MHGGVSRRGRASLTLRRSAASTAPRATALPCLPGMAKVELSDRAGPAVHRRRQRPREPPLPGLPGRQPLEPACRHAAGPPPLGRLRRERSAPTADLHADFGSFRRLRHPVQRRAARPATPVPVRFTAYGDESDPGPYPIPAARPIEARQRPPRAGRRRGRLQALRAVRAPRRRRPAGRAASGAIFDLTSNALRPAGWTSADAAGLPIFPGLVRYDEVRAGRHPPRAALHRPAAPSAATSCPARHWASAAPTRPAAHGPAPAAQGGLRHRRASTARRA